MDLQVFESHSHWKAVLATIKSLHSAGYEAYLAGGCVRDLLLGRTPSDFDIATEANPDQIMALFPSTEAVGKSFGVILVKQNHLAVEVATFRKDLEYKDGRRPEQVEWTDVKGDSQRRDFTINAMYFDVQNTRVLDFHGGQSDIKLRQIRAVGEVKKRFQEDYLRILRALRFSGQLQFTIEHKTFNEISQQKHKVSKLPKERVHPELSKLFSSPRGYFGHYYLFKSGVLEVLLDGLFCENTIMLHRLREHQDFPRVRSYLEFVFLLISEFRLGVKSSSFISLGFSNIESKTLLQWLELREFVNRGDIYLSLQLIGKLSDLAVLRYSCFHKENLQKLILAYDKVSFGLESLPEPLVKGKDLLKLGFKGASVGSGLDKALENQWLKSVHDKEKLLKLL